MNFVALIHEEDGKFGVSFPDLPGATTVGSSAQDAIVKAEGMLAFHLEGLAEDGDVPQPRSIDALRNDKDFQEDAQGALIALVSYAPPTKAVRVNVTLDEGLLGRIDRAAEAIGETRSGFLAEAARERMAKVA